VKSSRTVVTLLVILPQLWIFQGGGWNQNSRFALSRALLLRGSVSIDPDADVTRDLAFRDGHTYCDKAPAVSFAAAAALAIAGPIASACGLEPDRPAWWRAVPYAVTVLAISLPVALTAGALYAFLAALFSPLAALLAVAAIFLGSPLLGYAGLLYGHAPAGCLIALGYLALAGKGARACAWAGLAASVAICVEYTAALGAVFLFAYALADPSLRKSVWSAFAAATPPLFLLALYHTAAFGSPLGIGYAHLPAEQFQGMGKGLFGLHLPRPQALWQLTFGEHRGLFRFAPVLLLALPGSALLWKKRRADVILSLGLCLGFLLLNAGYVYWDGHASFGPRHALPGAVLLAVPLAAAARRWPALFLALLVPSLLICGLAWCTRPEAAPLDWSPIQDSWLPFWNKDAIGASIFWFNARDPLDYRSGFSLPLLVGLDGRAALLPLIPLVAGLLLLWRRAVGATVRP